MAAIGLIFAKYFIDESILIKCPHGVIFGYVKRRCEKCELDRLDTEKPEPPALPLQRGTCESCGVKVEKRYKHLEISSDEELKYDSREIDEFVTSNRFHPLFKTQLHLRHYPPIQYYPKFCDTCFKSNFKHYKNTYKFKPWGESFPMKKMRTRLNEETASRGRLTWPLKQTVELLNPMIQGWRNYYAHLDVDRSMANRFLAKVDWYILRRLRLFWNNKHRKRKRNWSEMHILLQITGLKTLCTWIKPYCHG
ncbi:group II intron maturase-specific domain-containing protein [Paenibacillus anseongense]|uniref:group II intron maturase-specific domain-containing protein n=1 Tax=Paenibacillus anseongense TaxID=2682845 RepID=UPI002DB99F06|nr:group II intron maturase-specific domain-containing protein [Paenibacillus anseongense]MEC0264532.1 group II intron maturase-specific domain-containing protein [Paenibacillus anseongense]